LAAAKLEIPIAHVEAGMRSGVMTQPEEINRIVADRLASALFCASPSSVENLRREGMTDGVVLSGDVMHELLVGVKPRLKASGGVLGRYGLEPGGFALMTVHRASNVDDPDNLAKLLDILASVDLPVLLPLHPRTRDRLRRFRLTRALNRLGNVVVVEPLGYFDTLAAARHARVVFTDSGGLQKEALYLGTPVLVMREETEWVETLKQGNYLVGLDQRRIASLLKRRLKARPPGYRVRGRRPSEIIISCLAALLARS